MMDPSNLVVKEPISDLHFLGHYDAKEHPAKYAAASSLYQRLILIFDGYTVLVTEKFC